MFLHLSLTRSQGSFIDDEPYEPYDNLDRANGTPNYSKLEIAPSETSEATTREGNYDLKDWESIDDAEDNLHTGTDSSKFTSTGDEWIEGAGDSEAGYSYAEQLKTNPSDAGDKVEPEPGVKAEAYVEPSLGTPIRGQSKIVLSSSPVNNDTDEPDNAGQDSESEGDQSVDEVDQSVGKVALPDYETKVQEKEPADVGKVTIPDYSSTDQEHKSRDVGKLQIPDFGSNVEDRAPAKVGKVVIPDYSTEQESQSRDVGKLQMPDYGSNAQDKPPVDVGKVTIPDYSKEQDHQLRDVGKLLIPETFAAQASSKPVTTKPKVTFEEPTPPQPPAMTASPPVKPLAPSVEPVQPLETIPAVNSSKNVPMPSRVRTQSNAKPGQWKLNTGVARPKSPISEEQRKKDDFEYGLVTNMIKEQPHTFKLDKPLRKVEKDTHV